MMAAIICDVYNIDLDALKAMSHEAKAEPKIHEVEVGPSMQVEEEKDKPVLSKEEWGRSYLKDKFDE